MFSSIQIMCSEVTSNEVSIEAMGMISQRNIYKHPNKIRTDVNADIVDTAYAKRRELYWNVQRMGLVNCIL